MNKLIVQFNKKTLFVYFLLIIIFFISDDTFTFGTIAKSSLISFKYILYVMVLICLISKTSFDYNIKKSSFYFFIILLSIIITFLLNFDFRGGYAYQLFVVVLAFFIVKKIEYDDFIKIYNKILFFLCNASLLVFIVANTYSDFLKYFPVYENIRGVEFANLYIASVIIKSVGVIRNTGIFREPGVYMIYILLGIIFELFYFERPRIIFCIVFFTTLMTTYSTAGVVAFIVVITGYIISSKSSTSWFKLIIFIISSLLITYLLVNESSVSMLFSKIDQDSLSYNSTLARIASIFVNLHIFMDNLLFGSGLTNYVTLYESTSNTLYGIPLRADGQSANSFMSLFATYGIIYGSIVMFSFYKLAKKISKKTKMTISTLVILTSFLLMFSNEDMRYSLLFNTIIFFGLAKDTIMLTVPLEKRAV